MIKINGLEIRKEIENGEVGYNLYDSDRCFSRHRSLRGAIFSTIVYENSACFLML